MIKKIVIRNGKKYIVNVPSWPEFGMDLGIGSAGTSSVSVGPVDSFNTSSIAGLFMWFDATIGPRSGSIPATVDSSSVTGWECKVNTIHELSQSIVISTPIWLSTIANGKPAVRFDGINDYMFADNVTSNPLPNTIITVFKLRNTGSYQVIFDGAPTNRWEFNEYPAGSWDMWISSGTDVAIGTSNTNWNIAMLHYSGSNSKYAFNTNTFSTTSASPGTNAMKGIYVGANGANNPSKLDIAEIMWFTGSNILNSASIVTSYLSAKYGITVV